MLGLSFGAYYVSVWCYIPGEVVGEFITFWSDWCYLICLNLIEAVHNSGLGRRLCFRPRLHWSELFRIREICFRIHESVYTGFGESGISCCETGNVTNPKSKVRYFVSGILSGVNPLFRIRWASVSFPGSRIITESSNYCKRFHESGNKCHESGTNASSVYGIWIRDDFPYGSGTFTNPE